MCPFTASCIAASSATHPACTYRLLQLRHPGFAMSSCPPCGSRLQEECPGVRVGNDRTAHDMPKATLGYAEVTTWQCNVLEIPINQSGVLTG